MSRFEGMPLAIPKGVEVVLEKKAEKVVLRAKGPKGELEQVIYPSVVCEKKDEALFFKATEKNQENFVGMCYRLAANQLQGVMEGFKKALEISGVGYRWSVAGKTLQLQLGFSHPVSFTPPDEVAFNIDKSNVLTVEGIDRQKVGAAAAKIKSFRPVEPYKGKGIRYQGQYVLRKSGKASTK